MFCFSRISLYVAVGVLALGCFRGETSWAVSSLQSDHLTDHQDEQNFQIQTDRLSEGFPEPIVDRQNRSPAVIGPPTYETSKADEGVTTKSPQPPSEN